LGLFPRRAGANRTRPKGAKQVAIGSLAIILNNLVDIIEELRVRITIVEDVVAEKIIARIILLTATMRKDPRCNLHGLIFKHMLEMLLERYTVSSRRRCSYECEPKTLRRSSRLTDNDLIYQQFNAEGKCSCLPSS
jgi:hypothetical protein